MPNTPKSERATQGQPDVELGPCHWFAGCRNQATSMMAHPILGQVPICDRCRARVEAIGADR